MRKRDDEVYMEFIYTGKTEQLKEKMIEGIRKITNTRHLQMLFKLVQEFSK